MTPPTEIFEHLSADSTVHLLEGGRSVGLITWAGPGAEAEQAAIDLIDVLARAGRTRPTLVVGDGFGHGAGTAVAELLAQPWARYVNFDDADGGVAAAVGRLTRETGGDGARLRGPLHSLRVLWSRAVQCHRHDQANAVRRLRQLADADRPGPLARYLTEHGPEVLGRVAEADRRLREAADWYIPVCDAGRISDALRACEVALSRLVEQPSLGAATDFLEAERALALVTGAGP